MSETKKYRSLFLPYCKGTGLDIGFGGDSICKNAINLDLPEGQRYSFCGIDSQHIFGSATDLSIFSNNSLDYVYSSHCLEDFKDTIAVLEEWIRVIKFGGYLLLLLPNERVYRERSKTHNVEHKHLNFSLGYVLNIIEDINCSEKSYDYHIKPVEAGNLFDNNDYNFYIIAQKIKS